MPTLTWTYTDYINAVGKPIDFEVFDEIQSNVILVNDALASAVGVSVGVSTFNGDTGRVITFASPQGDANYLPIAIASTNSDGNLGEVSYSNITINGFTVHNAGSYVGTMKWKILR